MAGKGTSMHGGVGGGKAAQKKKTVGVFYMGQKGRAARQKEVLKGETCDDTNLNRETIS